uniref:Putative MCP methylation inhibitor CheC-like protein n=1 Tax=Magnetococcus massalia (strain MO-1) TaxID=451514 RepID=A0A1S7LCN1_MAGMO|nr:putative MCP methylation inhibitor CheC-like protein [Candidatus Magnetococcus massalia]
MARIHLDASETDALKELFNIGIGRAANALGQMVHDEVFLSVPEMAIVSRDEALELIVRHSAEQVAAIRQGFHGQFSGSALLVYPESNSLELVRSLLGEDIPLESLTELEQESLLEVGNVILNACLGSFANLMNLELTFDLPEFMKGQSQKLLAISSHDLTSSETPLIDDGHVVFLIVDFITGDNTPKKHHIKGYVILLLDAVAVENLRQMIAKMLQGGGGGA